MLIFHCILNNLYVSTPVLLHTFHAQSTRSNFSRTMSKTHGKHRWNFFGSTRGSSPEQHRERVLRNSSSRQYNMVSYCTIWHHIVQYYIILYYINYIILYIILVRVTLAIILKPMESHGPVVPFRDPIILMILYHMAHII